MSIPYFIASSSKTGKGGAISVQGISVFPPSPVLPPSPVFPEPPPLPEPPPFTISPLFVLSGLLGLEQAIAAKKHNIINKIFLYINPPK